jgi:hypothetical protein
MGDGSSTHRKIDHGQVEQILALELENDDVARELELLGRVQGPPGVADVAEVKLGKLFGLGHRDGRVEDGELGATEQAFDIDGVCESGTKSEFFGLREADVVGIEVEAKLNLTRPWLRRAYEADFEWDTGARVLAPRKADAGDGLDERRLARALRHGLSACEPNRR